MKKKELTQEQVRECNKLKAIYEAKKRPLGLSQQSIADELGDATQGAISHYLNARNALNLKAAQAFSNRLQVPISDFSRRLAREQQKMAHGVAEPESVYGLPVRKVPVISWVAAGEWCDSEDPFEPGDADEWVLSPFDCSDSAFCLIVEGTSMLPEYREGEYILVDPGIEPRHGDDVVARKPDGKYTFKRLQITTDGVYLMALNPDYPDRYINIVEDTSCCGVVVGSWKKRRK